MDSLLRGGGDQGRVQLLADDHFLQQPGIGFRDGDCDLGKIPVEAVKDIPKEQYAFGRRDAEADHAQLQHPHLLELPHGRLVGAVDLLDLFQKQLPGIGGVNP